MPIKYLIFKDLDNAISAALDLERRFVVGRSMNCIGEIAVVDCYDENHVHTHRFIVDEKLHAISAYQDQGD